MTQQEFISGLAEELELETAIDGSTNLRDLDEWDSMTAMMLIGYVSNEFGIMLTDADIKAMTSVDGIIQKIGTDKFD